MHSYEIIPSLQKILKKLSKRDRTLYESVLKKIEEIIHSVDVDHYKNLRHNMKDMKRVHVGSFILVFKYMHDENKIVFIDFDHHDKIYKFPE